MTTLGTLILGGCVVALAVCLAMILVDLARDLFG